ncbi:hypothetical protein LS633_25335 [Pseudomonas sp. NIBR-H-19]|uniref:hypothetical protein n=1 Tax=Pseudomonas sp. NIBR-H-19 TaxID=2901380 RepID=UPI001E56B826|nr:hypothetical protein [Pseudomonas sp. NIBR-H-19]UHC81692.1 hypothetical protein LS633_25335 [Pseudomonas sp. NIBR-H-19]
MPLTKPNQQLRRDFKAIVFNLEQSCMDLGKLAEKLSDADAIALMGLVGTLYEEADRLVGYAEEVKVERITRLKQQPFVQVKITIVIVFCRYREI